jgi:hypothetical protein
VKEKEARTHCAQHTHTHPHTVARTHTVAHTHTRTHNHRRARTPSLTCTHTHAHYHTNTPRAQRALARSSVSPCGGPVGRSCLCASRSWRKSSPPPNRNRYGASGASLGGMRLATAALVQAQAPPSPADKPIAGVASGPTAKPVAATPPGPAPPAVRAVRRIPAATRLRVGSAWCCAGGHGACGSGPSGPCCRRAGFARAPIRPAPHTRRRFPQLPKAAAPPPSTYLGAANSLNFLYLKQLLSVALANYPTGLTVTGTGVYSMGGTGTVASQIGNGCTMEQRAEGSRSRYFIVSKSGTDLLCSSMCRQCTHPSALAWTCLAGSSRPGEPVTVRIVGTRNRTRQRHTHEQ